MPAPTVTNLWKVMRPSPRHVPSRRAGRLGAIALVALIAVVAVTATVPTALARFTSSASAAATLATDSLTAPSGLHTSGTTSVALSWTPTVDTWASGYRVLRGSSSGGPYTQIATVTSQSATTTTDAPSPGTWYYVLRSYYQSWVSGNSNEAAITISAPTTQTGFRGCASQAADTGGDGDGYESSPGSACLPDGVVARDAGSGTNTALSCSDTGKDRHRFWDFALGVPGSAASIDGIEVRVDIGLNNNGGSSLLCAQLSWNGGSSWTALRQVSLTSKNVAAYLIGGAADTWGRTWAATELADSAFRLRLVDVSSQASKTFELDGVAVQVTYRP